MKTLDELQLTEYQLAHARGFCRVLNIGFLKEEYRKLVQSSPFDGGRDRVYGGRDRVYTALNRMMNDYMRHNELQRDPFPLSVLQLFTSNTMKLIEQRTSNQ